MERDGPWRRAVSPQTRLLKVLLKIAWFSIWPAAVINLSKATAVAWVQTVRNPAGEREVSNEEDEPFSATASKQQRKKWLVRGPEMSGS